MTQHICPNCRATEALAVQVVTRHGLGPSELIKCAMCGEVRHWTHWKTPKEHDDREERVAVFIKAMR